MLKFSVNADGKFGKAVYIKVTNPSRTGSPEIHPHALFTNWWDRFTKRLEVDLPPNADQLGTVDSSIKNVSEAYTEPVSGYVQVPGSVDVGNMSATEEMEEVPPESGR